MILLLCDNEKRATSLQNDLTREGFEVAIYKDFGPAMLDLSQGGPFKLILLDFEFKKPEGIDICTKLKNNSLTKFIPLICILGKERLVDQIMAFEVGADDFILMPYSTPEIQLKMRSIQRMIDLQNTVRQKDAQLENLKNVQRIMVTLNHHINNALTPLYFAVQMDDDPDNNERLRDIAKETVEFISKVLQSLHKIVQSGKMQVMKDGVYKDIMVDIEAELKKLVDKEESG
ncbi:MAG: response regulator transcription factor [Calditrichia bacterium]